MSNPTGVPEGAAPQQRPSGIVFGAFPATPLVRERVGSTAPVVGAATSASDGPGLAECLESMNTEWFGVPEGCATRAEAWAERNAAAARVPRGRNDGVYPRSRAKPLWRRFVDWMYPTHRFITQGDEDVAHGLIETSELDDPKFGTVTERATEKRGGDMVETKLRTVPRVEGWKFVADWVRRGKLEFPSVYRSTKTMEADRACVEIWVRNQMRNHSVRDRDAVRYLPRIVTGIFIPSTEQVEAEHLLATERVKRQREAAAPVKPGWFWRWCLVPRTEE